MIIKKEEFFANYLKKANQMFNFKFDYSKFDYQTAKIKSIIICPIHGEFIQNMDKHTAKNSKGCPQCWNDNRPYPSQLENSRLEVIPYDETLKKLEFKFGNKYQFVKESYKGASKKMTIVCPIHGEFNVTPIVLLKSKVGCSKCGYAQSKNTRTDSYENFISQANKIHEDKYIYPESNKEIYKNKKSKIEIICREHGSFIKSAQKHISGQGCFKCKINELVTTKKLIGGYSKSLFLENPELKHKKATLYLLEINDYYKIGITTKPINIRINAIIHKAKRMGDAIKVNILKLEEDTLYNCFVKEQDILESKKDCRLYKKWSTELFKHL